MSTAAAEVPADLGFDWFNPDYAGVYRERLARLHRIRSAPALLPGLRAYYAENLADFINDFGLTCDPRGALQNPPKPVVMPFLLFPKQREWVDWVLQRAKLREPGLTEKSRDCGVSWLAMCLAVSLCLFNRNLNIGVGSAKEDKIDRSGDPDCLFWKARFFLKNLPPEFRGGWDDTQHSAHLRLTFPETQSSIVGEAGDNIGRGGRTSVYLVDEAAHLDRPKLIEASLASNTDCRIDISSVAGTANPFAEKRHSGRVKVFTFSWRNDPRKGDSWYARMCDTLDPVTLASEVNIDYHASTQGSLIPMAWAQSAVGALERLGVKPRGMRRGGLDVADEGIDANAFCGRHGPLIEVVESWSGKGGDIFDTVCRAFGLCDQFKYKTFLYDADGLGAGVRGDARVINERRGSEDKESILDEAYRGSASPVDPDDEMVEGRKNADFFANLKSMSWWSLRMRLQATHRAITEGKPVDPDMLISIPQDLPQLGQLLQELSQPTYSINLSGRIVVDKTPPGFRSPNLADAVVIAFSPLTNTLENWIKLGQSELPTD
jgi:phage terminase large subunit